MTIEEKVLEIIKRLYAVYLHPKTALNFETPFQLLVATILSAQATDKVVNTVTPQLFEKYPTPFEMSKTSEEAIDSLISKVNFHKNKAKNIRAASQMIVEKLGGKVPETMEELITLPGVARKTANVVLGDAFNKPQGVTVDTHVMRLSQKLGLTQQNEPVKIEQDLMKIVPKQYWRDFPHLLILHGREMCTARPHTCHGCPLKELCPDMKV